MNSPALNKSAPAFAVPEPDLTPDELVARARNMRERLRKEQAATEERGKPSAEMHEAFRQAGFYRVLQPRKFGGYEFGVDVFSRMVFEVARGCPGSGWYLSLASGHALNAAAFFEESAQRAMFGLDGEFRAPARAIPGGTARPTEGGWIVNGVWDYCSGVPYSTHALVSVRIVDAGPDAAPVGLVMVPRAGYEILDNWRDFIGMKGSGSNSIEIKDAFVPSDHLVFQDVFNFSIAGGTNGYHIHKNPMYSGRGMGFFQIEITSILVGAGYAALDEYERLIRTRPAPMSPPGTLQYQHPDFQRPHGLALGKLELARLALEAGCRQYMEMSARGVEDPASYTECDDLLLQAALQHSADVSLSVIDTLYRAAGTSAAAKDGSHLQRYYRDMSMAVTNPGLQFERMAARLSMRVIGEG